MTQLDRKTQRQINTSFMPRLLGSIERGAKMCRCRPVAGLLLMKHNFLKTVYMPIRKQIKQPSPLLVAEI